MNNGPNASNLATTRRPGLVRCGFSVLARFSGLCALPAVLAACSVHYADSAKGVQHVWGIGRTTWETKTLTNNLVAVSSGFRLPGLVLGVGPDFLGVSLGYHIRERMQIVSPEQEPDRAASLNGHPLKPETSHRWGIGWFQTHTPRDAGIAFIRGQAEAGLALAVERGSPVAAAGWQTRQTTVIRGDDVLVEWQSRSSAWPYFDFPEAGVSAAISEPQPTKVSQP
jgi:hypothetical protein